MTKYQAVLIRFCKGFIASAIPIIVSALSGITQFNNLTEVKAFLISIAIPIVTGLLLAFEKAINWVEPETPVEIDEAKPSKKS
jgi:hypothetical protein